MKKTVQSLDAFRANKLDTSLSSNILGGVCTGGGFMQSPKTGTAIFAWTSDDVDGDTTSYYGGSDGRMPVPPGGGQA
ncbi:hypothetical protein BH11BAC7_BH11BAC7_26580 [soil metagenome]